MSELALVINIIDDLSLQLSIMKKTSDKKYHSIQTKNGLSGWLLFRRVHAAEYEWGQANGNMITSAIAKNWQKLSKNEKLRWREIAENPDVCGNRWINFV